MMLKQIKYWFLSLFKAKETAKTFKKTGIEQGIWNITLSHLVPALFMIALIVSINQNTIQQLIRPLGILVIGVVSWMSRSYVYHLSATLLGGKSNYKNYAGLLSFPLAGTIAIGTILLAGSIYVYLDATIAYLILILLPLASIIKITENTHKITTKKAAIAVIIPTIAMVLLSFLFSANGIIIF
ncbi:hypothetical protein K8R43_01955 [archaeon]|nr:hypothetical protein [archaeon]